MMRPDISPYLFLHADPGVCGGNVCLGDRHPVRLLLRSLAYEPTIRKAINDIWAYSEHTEEDLQMFGQVLLYAADCVEACDEAAP